MPSGKRGESATSRPCASRTTCQQSSITTYRYPASRMPLATMASAVSRISRSETSHPKWFQLFQPIGGGTGGAVFRGGRGGGGAGAGQGGGGGGGPPPTHPTKASLRGRAGGPPRAP